MVLANALLMETEAAPYKHLAAVTIFQRQRTTFGVSNSGVQNETHNSEQYALQAARNKLY